MDWMILPLRRYFDFKGRSQRMEYWMFALFLVLATLACNVLDSVLGLGGSLGSYSATGPGVHAAGADSSGGVLSALFSFAVLIPSIAVGVRRLHDIDRTGWWLLVPFALVFVGFPLAMYWNVGVGMIGGAAGLLGGIGWLVLLVWACLDGTAGPNRFGPDPKAR